MFCCAGADDAVNAHARSVTAFGPSIVQLHKGWISVRTFWH